MFKWKLKDNIREFIENKNVDISGYARSIYGLFGGGIFQRVTIV